MLLVMDTAGIFHSADSKTGFSDLWEITWERIVCFLPHLREELFKQTVIPGTQRTLSVTAGAYSPHTSVSYATFLFVRSSTQSFSRTSAANTPNRPTTITSSVSATCPGALSSPSYSSRYAYPQQTSVTPGAPPVQCQR